MLTEKYLTMFKKIFFREFSMIQFFLSTKFNLRVDMDVLKLNRDGFKQNDLEVGRGVSGFL